MSGNTKAYSLRINYLKDKELVEILDNLPNRNKFLKDAVIYYLQNEDSISFDDKKTDESELVSVLYQHSLELKQNVDLLTKIVLNGGVPQGTTHIPEPKITFYNEEIGVTQLEDDEEELERQLEEERKRKSKARKLKNNMDGW